MTGGQVGAHCNAPVLQACPRVVPSSEGMTGGQKSHDVEVRCFLEGLVDLRPSLLEKGYRTEKFQ
jgi:hypothetical protein